MHVLDIKNGFSVVHSWTDHKDCIYSLKTIGNLSLSGGGNGWLLVHNIETGKCLYGLGANEHAVRCIEYTDTKLVTAGDDGKAIIFDMENVV